MLIIKVSNLIQVDGRADYKGLELSQIVGGTQLYPSYENSAYFFYDGEVENGNGVQIISQVVYDEHKNRIEEEQANVLTPEKRIEKLEEENANLRLEMAQSNTELFEMMVAMNGGISWCLINLAR